MTAGLEKDIASRAGRQHGLITRQQLYESELGDASVRYRVRAGQLQRVRHDVFAIPGAPQTREQSYLAAVLAFGPGAVLSHESAAVLWEVPNISHDDSS